MLKNMKITVRLKTVIFMFFCCVFCMWKKKRIKCIRVRNRRFVVDNNDVIRRIL